MNEYFIAIDSREYEIEGNFFIRDEDGSIVIFKGDAEQKNTWVAVAVFNKWDSLVISNKE